MPGKITRFVLAALGISGSLMLTMCGGGGDTGNTTGTTCPAGICGVGGGGASASSSSGTGASSSSGTMSSSSGTMSSSSGSTSSSTSTGGVCTSAWSCTPWDTGGTGNMATRQCTDANNCQPPTNPPATTATLPGLDESYFKCNVEPIFDKKCGMLGCHGTETGRSFRVYSKGRLRDAGSTITSIYCPSTKSGSACIGAVSCPCNGKHTDTEWQRNFDSARGFGLDPNGNPISDPSQSELIQQAVVGGKSHAGIHLFKNGDPDYTTLVNWLGGATAPANCSIGNN